MKKGHMKNISVLLFIIAFGIGKTAAQTVEKKQLGCGICNMIPHLLKIS
ncbi:MAG: hypothetical protein IPJ22_02370 [Bacteroidetes bacterium]|nr:hypothetical protein [Bacteroidota bacterium]